MEYPRSPLSQALQRTWEYEMLLGGGEELVFHEPCDLWAKGHPGGTEVSAHFLQVQNVRKPRIWGLAIMTANSLCVQRGPLILLIKHQNTDLSESLYPSQSFCSTGSAWLLWPSLILDPTLCPGCQMLPSLSPELLLALHGLH